jgi:hypothetical protein
MKHLYTPRLRAARSRVAALTFAAALGSVGVAAVAQTAAPAPAPAPGATPALQVVQTVRAEFATPINAAQNLLAQGQLDEAMRNVALAAAVESLVRRLRKPFTPPCASKKV